MKKQITALCLFCAMLASSCGGEAPLDTTAAPESQDTTAELPADPAGIEKADFGGAKFNIFSPVWGLYQHYFFAEEETGDIMNDALYDRDRRVEEHLNVDITYQHEGTTDDVVKKVREVVMADDDIYQLVLTHCISGVAEMVTSQYLYDFNEFEEINLSADWWNHNANERLSVGGRQYYAISDYMIADPNGILFNKDMLNELKLENPYDIVRSGKWTIDKMMEMAKKATRDLDGNSKYDEKDQYGYSMPDGWNFNSYYYSSDIFLLDKNEDGEFYLAVGGDRTITLMEKMHALLDSPDSYIYPSSAKDETKLTIDSGRCLFFETPLNQLLLYRNTQTDFGILPFPKLDEAQENYTNNDWSGLMCVPITARETEMIAKAVELLGYYGSIITKPVYFDYVLGEKLSRDEDSKEMLNLIFDNIVFDAGMNYFGFNGSVQPLFNAVHRHIYANNTADFASYYATYEAGANETIEEFNEIVRGWGDE